MKLDANHDGYLEVEEVRNGLTENNVVGSQQVETIIQVLMCSETHISYEEFMGQLIAVKEPEENQLLSHMFNEFDTERKGYLNIRDISEILSRPSVARVMGVGETPETVLQKFDKDHNSVISFEEFKAVMHPRKDSSPVQCKPGHDTKMAIGLEVQFYSASYNCWMDCTV